MLNTFPECIYYQVIQNDIIKHYIHMNGTTTTVHVPLNNFNYNIINAKTPTLS